MQHTVVQSIIFDDWMIVFEEYPMLSLYNISNNASSKSKHQKYSTNERKNLTDVSSIGKTVELSSALESRAFMEEGALS
jgi:hypothetical protein